MSEYCRKHKVKKIIQLSIDNKFIKEWESAVEVEKCLGISRKNISQCITGKNKTAGGFKWVTHEQFASIEYKVEEDK